MSSSTGVPTFDPKGERYDPSTVWGRFKNNLLISDPRLLLLSNETVRQQADLVKEVEQKGRAGITASDVELWYAKSVKDSSVHPDTNEIIPRPFRMCGFVPFGTPIVVFMLLPSTAGSAIATGIAQWGNQSHNAAINWCNRSAAGGDEKDENGEPIVNDPTMDIARGYAAAVTSAVGIGVGANKLVDSLKCSAATKSMLKRYTPFPAVCCASVCNMVMMRLPELQRGIPVFNAETDEKIGVSKEAAKVAIANTAVVRAVLVACAVLLPQIIYSGMEAGMKLQLAKRASWRLPSQAIATLLGFGLGVPLSLSAFEREVRMSRSGLEPQLQGPGMVKFNKGL